MTVKHGLSLSTAAPISDPTIYRQLTGRLIYLTITWPDLAFSVHVLSQYMAQPTDDHLKAAHRLLRYIKLAPTQGLFFPAKSDLQLTAFCDANWASCPITRRSVSGYCVLLGSSVISWKTKKQAVVSRSSAESEYRAMAAACSKVTWLVCLLSDLRIQVPTPVTLYCDNQSAIHISQNPIFHEQTKQVEIDCHFIRQHINSGLLNPTAINTNEQPADIFTKALPQDQLQYLVSKLGVSNFLHNPA
ncbi:unnamed protein product [Rhodiola kirilowii]